MCGSREGIQPAHPGAGMGAQGGREEGWRRTWEEEAVKRLLDVGQEGWYEREDRYLGCFVMPMI